MTLFLRREVCWLISRNASQGSCPSNCHISRSPFRCKTMEEPKKVEGVKITILGANGRIGSMTAMQLRLSPYVAKLALHDLTSTERLMKDLYRIPSSTHCALEAYHGPLQIIKALKGAQIVLLIAGRSWRPGMSEDDLFALNAGMVYDLAHACAWTCPEAILGVITPPTNSNVPLVCEVMKQEHRYNPDLIVGMSTLQTITANSIVARTHDLNPVGVEVPVIGGASMGTTVPILSQAMPYREFSESMVEDLTGMIRMALVEVMASGVSRPVASTSFAITRFTLTLAKAILGHRDAVMCAYVRSNIVPTVPYLTTLLRFDNKGVAENFGLPRMSTNEIYLLGIALHQLEHDIKRGIKFAKSFVEKDMLCVGSC